ncbi:MAG: porin family protein [Ginsengibacter sp.]
MKKINFLIIAMLLMTYGAEAQISFGLKAGVNFSSLKGNGYTDPDQKPFIGLAIGGLANYTITEKLSIQPELIFSQEGTQWKATDEEQKNRLNYLNVPILVQYRTPSGFFVHTGPQIGLLLSAKMTYKDHGAGGMVGEGDWDKEEHRGGQPPTLDIKRFYAGSPISWGLGAGFIHQSGFGIIARYNIGLTNALKKASDGTIYSRIFNIGIIYMPGSLKK